MKRKALIILYIIIICFVIDLIFNKVFADEIILTQIEDSECEYKIERIIDNLDNDKSVNTTFLYDVINKNNENNNCVINTPTIKCSVDFINVVPMLDENRKV